MNARRCVYRDLIPNILHPSQVDLGVPFEYHAALYEETFSGGGQGPGYIAAAPRGIEFWPNFGAGGKVVSQLVTAIQPDATKRFMVALRFLIDHPEAGGGDGLFGLWSTESNPFDNPPDDGVYFEHTHALGGGQVIAVVRKSGSNPYESDVLFTVVEGSFYDVAIILHKTSAVEFLWLENRHRWRSLHRSTDIPTASMRPSMGAKRTSATISGLVIRSFQLIGE